MDLRGNAVTWLGHGTWLWETSAGGRLLVDCWTRNNPACPEEYREPGGLGTIDGILITHGHFDHLTDAVEIIRATGAPAFAIFETAVYLGGRGLETVTGFNKGGTVEVAGCRATMVNAVHSGGITAEDGTIVEGGDPAGYVVEFPDGLVVYHAGDTDVFGDMALIAEIYRPDVAVLPIGDLYTMSPRQAAHAVRLLGVRRVLCGHWGTFPPLTGRPARLRELVGKGVDIPDLEPGRRFG